MTSFPFYSTTVRPMRFVHDQSRTGWELKFDIPLTELVWLNLAHYSWKSEKDYHETKQRLEDESENAKLRWEKKNAANALAEADQDWEKYHQVLSGKKGKLAGQQHAEAILYGSASDRWYERSIMGRSKCLVFMGTVWENPDGVLFSPCLLGHSRGLKLDFRPIDAERQGTALVFLESLSKQRGEGNAQHV